MKNKKPAKTLPNQFELLQRAVLFHQSGKLDEAFAQYKKLLKFLPDNAELLTTIASLAFQQGRFEEGIRLTNNSLLINANQPVALNNLGNALRQLNRREEALTSYGRVIALNPDFAEAYSNRGIVLKDLKRLDEALINFERAISLNPNLAEAYYNQGNTQQELKRLDEALISFERAIALKPDFAEAYSNRGNALKDLKRLDEALADYDRAIALKPDFTDAYSNRGNALKDLNRLDEALADYDRAIALKPDFAETYSNRGNALKDLNRLDEALASIDRAIALKPDFAEAYCSRGNALKDLKRLDEAFAGFDRAIALMPDFAEAYSNRGNALKDLNRLDEALADYDRAIVLKPDFAEAYSNRGNALKDLNRLDEALADYDRAIALDPNYAEAYWNKSLLKILNGEYEEGWRLYEWRWKCKQNNLTPRVYPQPLWLGELPLFNKILLIYPEQGLGDYIQFMRYAPLVEQLGAKVVLEAPVSLISMASTLEGQFTLIETGQPLPDYDCHCPVASLPLAFKTAVETIPAKIPYLHADQDKQTIWRQRLGEKSTPKVGLVWSGLTWHKNDHNRSIAIKQFQALFELPIEFHCLQKEIRSDDALFIAGSRDSITTHQDLLKDFSDTAALVAEMDLVISVDTSVAHLAGALGKQVWILLPYAPDYRWMRDRTDSPWYPTSTLFRQPAIGDWDSVIAEIVVRLNRLS